MAQAVKRGRPKLSETKKQAGLQICQESVAGESKSTIKIMVDKKIRGTLIVTTGGMVLIPPNAKKKPRGVISWLELSKLFRIFSDE